MVTYEGNGKEIVFICGPITGVEDYREKFNSAQERLESMGYIVLNPALLPEGMPHDYYMPITCAMIDASKKVFLLPGFSNSIGCAKEIDYAVLSGKEVKRYDYNRDAV
ncbi:MAG: DUF4406 domain-containing protein [Oscillospiraceae bacterium]|jgi:hypothetical protein